MIATRRFMLIAAVYLAASCAGGTETGNPSVPKQIGLSVRSSNPTAVAVSRSTQGTVIDEAWVALGQLTFLQDGECGLLDSYPHTGPTLIAADLAAPDVRIAVEIKPGGYCGMVVPLENETRNLTGDEPSGLRDHSIVVSGHRRDGVAFTLAFPEQDELELQALAASGNFEVGELRGLLLAFDVAIWMNAVDLDQAELESDGTILIDETHNILLLAVFEQNIDCSLELFEDTNGSGALETGDKHIASCAPN